MDDGKMHGYRMKYRVTAYAIVLLLSCFMIAGDVCLAGDLAIVRGIVGSVSGTRVSLNGRSYDLAGIPLQNASGKERSIEDIRPGRKVALFHRRGVLTSVLVYDPMME